MALPLTMQAGQATSLKRLLKFIDFQKQVFPVLIG